MASEIGQIDPPSPKQQIWTLLLVLGSAMLLGCLIVVGMIRSWGPDGTYALTDVLLAPETLTQLAYQTQGPKGQNADKLVFDSITLQVFDAATRQWRTSNVSMDNYSHFYAAIAGDRSVLASQTPPSANFEGSNASQLTLWVRPKGARSADRQAFQAVDISTPGSTYRVEMHGSPTNQWIYFEHPGIDNIVHQVFIEHL